MLHVFITAGHFRRCHEVGLFGVRPSSLNQLAQVRPGDRAFIYERTAATFFGPYRCRRDVRYLGPTVERPVWEWAAPGSRREKFRYVIALEPLAGFNRLPVGAVYATAHALGIGLHAADFVKRSCYTFFPADGERLAAALSRHPRQQDLPFLAGAGAADDAAWLPVDAAHLDALLAHERWDESLLEFILAREGGALAREMGARPAFNQLRIDDRGDRIDLLYAAPNHLFVIELKTGRRDAEARRDIVRYELWARAHRREVAARLGLAGDEPAVTPVLVAAGGPPRPAECRIYDWRLEPGPARLTFDRVQ